MTGFIKHITGNIRTAALLALGLTAGVAGFAPSAALADDDGRYGDRYGKDYRHGDERRYDRDRRDHDRHDRHDHDRGGPRRGDKSDVKVEINLGGKPRPRYTERRVRYWVEPQYKVVSDRVWVEPVYKVVTERVWVEPVYRMVYEEVRVPARYEVREVTTRIGPARVTNRERMLIDPAHTKRIAREVCVSEGRWETIEKQVCVAPGHWKVVERHVCVSEGRWDYRVERVEFGSREAETRVDFRF